MLANLFTRFELEPYNTTAKDMQWLDFGSARPEGRIQVLAKRRVR